MVGLDPAAGACLVMAQHIPPSHHSLLAELLAPKTALKVRYLNRATRPAPNLVLVVPPNCDAVVENGKLTPLNFDPARTRGARPSIDRLFESLASEYGERAVGVVLSGTGSDGTAGAQAIKAAGGVVLVQDPQGAQFDSMPRAVIQAQVHDAVMPPEQIGAALVRIAKVQADGGEAASVFKDLPDRLTRQIKLLVRRRTGFNLDHYKASTVQRRLRRRSQLAGCDSMEDYFAFLSREPEEAQRLAGDLSVRVTSFFRDPRHFQALRPMIAEMVKRSVEGQVLRIWVPGCASGEEAYSLAILFAEEFRALKATPSFIMFVSDINPDAVNHARLGQYPEASLERMDPELRARYFEVREGRAEVSKTLRQYLIFASQNVVEDPPFSKLDLISCRNLLIYLEAPSQQQVLAAFHYALKPKGVLFLGASESPDVQRELFEAADGRSHIYLRREHPIVFQYQGHRRSDRAEGEEQEAGTVSRPATPVEKSPLSRKLAMERTRDIVAEHYSPPAIIIDSDDRIVHFVGDLSPFVTLPRGPTQWTAHQLVIAPLNAEMRALLHRCRKERDTVRGGSYTLEIKGQVCRVTLVAHPDGKDKSSLVMLAFETRPLAEGQDNEHGQSVGLIRELERELAGTREHLQTLVEEVETSNEELQTLNEELQSSNEELQSTNEEMQTANEELQSTNEELLTVNEELANKTSELETSRADLENIKDSLETAVIAVNETLTVTQFNRAAARLTTTGALRAGALLSSLDWTIPASGIIADVLEVMAGRVAPVRVLSENGSRSLRFSVSPYRLPGGGKATGAVLSFVDVEELLAAQRARRQQENLYQSMLQSSPSGIALTDVDGSILECNPAMAELMRSKRETLIGSRLESWLDEASGALLRSHLRTVTTRGGGGANLDVRLAGREQSTRWVSLELSAVNGEAGIPTQLVAQFHDIHERKRQQERLAADNQRMQIMSTLARQLLEAESIDAARAGVVDGLGLIFEDVHISYLSWTAEGGLVLRNRHESTVLNNQPLDSVPPAIHRPVALSASILRRLKAMQPEIRGVRDPLALAASAPARRNSEDGFQFDAPVFSGHELVGLLRLESPESRPWSDDDTLLLKSLADLLSMTEREHMERYLRELAYRDLSEQRERVGVTLQSIGDGVITTDEQGRVDYMNPTARELCEVTGEDFIGKALFSIYRPLSGEQASPVPNVVEKAIADQQPVEDASLDLYLLRSDGQKVPINHSASPIRNANGRCVGAVLVFRDVTHTRLLARELSHRATHDSLTGLANREELTRQAEAALLEAQAGSGRHAVLAVDLDRFKPVNDTAGHMAGDELLRQVARRIRGLLRESDVLARVGGDEFVALLRNCGEERAAQLAEGIIRAIGEIEFRWEERTFSIGASIGLATMSADSGSLAEVLDLADQGCYEAKRKGRGRLGRAVPTHTTDDTAGLLRRAIADEHCVVLRQTARPLGKSGQANYHELLMRIGVDGKTSLGPDSFIVAARRHQLMPDLEKLSIRSSIRALAGSGGAAAGDIYALNLFPEAVNDLALVKLISREFQDKGISPGSICLEIPESAAIRSDVAVRRFAAAAQKAGLLLAMDQFGSQLNSFSLIRSLDLQFVKINLRPQDLVSGRPNPVDRTVLEALCHICRQSGTRTVAVGVETAAVLEEMREIGIDYAQGALISEPEPFG